MEEGQHSATAEGCAVLRALHQLNAAEPRILDDPISPRLVDSDGPAYRTWSEFLERLPTANRTAINSLPAAKSICRGLSCGGVYPRPKAITSFSELDLTRSPTVSPTGRVTSEFLKSTILRRSSGSVDALLMHIFRFPKMSPLFLSI